MKTENNNITQLIKKIFFIINNNPHPTLSFLENNRE